MGQRVVVEVISWNRGWWRVEEVGCWGSGGRCNGRGDQTHPSFRLTPSIVVVVMRSHTLT